MTPREAQLHLTRNNIDYLPLDELEGRVATTLFVVYPPGIATDRAGRAARRALPPMIDYLKMFEKGLERLSGLRVGNSGPLSRNRRFRRRSLLYLCRQGVIRDDDGRRQTEFGSRARSSRRKRRGSSARDSRDADVPAMLAIYLHHIRRGVDPGLDVGEFETAGRRGPEAPAQEHAEAQDAAHRRGGERRGARLRLRRAVPQAPRLPLRRSSTRSTSTTTICAAASASS